MRSCACGNQIASNARSCPHCGKRLTSSITWLVAILFVGGLLFAFYDASKPIPKPVESPKTAQQQQDFDYQAAIMLCERWTEKNSRLAVEQFIHEYPLMRRAKSPKRFAVQLEYRTKGAGLPMRTTCEVAHDNPSADYVLISARSELND
jgi:hypothetical protein